MAPPPRAERAASQHSASDRPWPEWPRFRVVALLVTLIVLFVVPSLLLELAKPHLDRLWPVDPETEPDWAILIGQFLICVPALGAFALARWRYGLTLREVGFRPLGHSARAVLVGCLALIAWLIAIVALNAFDVSLETWVPGEPWPGFTLISFSLRLALRQFAAAANALGDVGISADLAAWFLLLGFLSPIVEEAGFRGIAYGWMRRHHGLVWSALFSAVTFAAYASMPDFLPMQVLRNFLLGLVLVFCYRGFNSVLPCLIVRSGTNIFIFVITFDWGGYRLRDLAG